MFIIAQDKDAPRPPPICGCIADILLGSDKLVLVVLKRWRILPERDEWYNMPVLVPEIEGEDDSYLIVPGNVCLRAISSTRR